MPTGFLHEEMPQLITSFHHVSINVSNLAHTVRFYLALGLPVIPLTPNQAFVITPNTGIVLTHTPHAHAPNREVHDLGWRHVCLQVPCISRAVDTCVSFGVTLLSTPVDLHTGHLYVYGRDTDDILYEIEEVPYTPFQYPSWLGHMAGVSDDVLRLKRFYAEFIGGDVVDPGIIGPNPAYDRVVGFDQTRLHPVWIKRLNLTIELWQFVQPVSPPRHKSADTTLGYQSIALVSDSIVTDAQHGCALGGTCINVSATHVIMTDCDGNRIDLYAPAHPLIRAIPSFVHPTLLNQNATHWRPRPHV